MQATKNIEYAIERLKQANKTSMSPAIYALWGSAIVLAYLLTMTTSIAMNNYWLVVMPIGIVLSILLGIRHNNNIGQENKSFGISSALHFSIMGGFYLVASLGVDPASGLLIVAFAYCLGAIHIDKFMSIFGVCALVSYVCIATNWIQSGYVIGGILASGLFATAIASSICQKRTEG